MSRYKAYGEHEDSGVDWLGDLPTHWQVAPLKYLATFSGGGTPSKDNPQYWNGDIPWVSPKDMKTKTIRSTIDNVTALAIHSSSTHLLDAGALLMVVRSGILQHSIPVAINEIPVTLNQDMKAIRFGAKINVKFAYYLIEGNQSSLLFAWGKQGATVESIEQEYLANTVLPIPPQFEQEQISDFLDHETAKIETLIAKQQQLIKLLKEKRQAVISHAVTRGLNPNAPMRDSGVEWLGEVPAHWVVGRYKFCTSRIVVGIAEAATHAYADVGVPILRSTNIREGGLDISGMLFINKAFADKNDSKYLFANDVITVRTGYPGISAVIPSELHMSQCFTNLVATPLKDIEPYFLTEYLNSHTGKSYFDLLGWGSAQKNISVPILQNIPIAFPNSDEQKSIVDFVGNQRIRYLLLIQKAELQIKYLQERRTALISAAVTGKINLCDWQPSENYTKESVL
ncbi:MAG: restriction endonuclease subunit S [Pseudomonadota bacterium]